MKKVIKKTSKKKTKQSSIVLTNQNQLEKLERQLHRLVDKIYDLSVAGRRLVPRHPYILVRVLPKEHITPGGIVLPETDQNKPVYEGIVLSTWAPYDEIRDKQYYRPFFHPKFGEIITERTIIHHECDVKPGDRVCFPHYEGIALGEYLDDKYYRLIREGNDQNKFPYCSVAGVVKYDGDYEVLNKIRKLTKKLGSVTTSGISVSRGEKPPVITTPA